MPSHTQNTASSPHHQTSPSVPASNITLNLSQLVQTHSEKDGVYHALLQRIIPPFIKALLEYTQGNKAAAARLAGFNRATLDRKIKHYNIVVEKRVSLSSQGDV